MEGNRGGIEDIAWEWQDLLADIYQVNQVWEGIQEKETEVWVDRWVGCVYRMTMDNAGFKKRRPVKMGAKVQIETWVGDRSIS